MPRTDDILDGMQGATVFSSLDLLSGYWQIPLREVDKEKTAFSATFQRVMDMILKGLLWHECMVYIDDVVVYSKDLDSHWIAWGM
jgi:hypothetical protein